MRRMYDAVTVGNIPNDATMVAGYVDGHYQTVHELERRFPHATIVRITVIGNTLNAQVADVETGDLTPQSGALWAHRKLSIGQIPTLYCSTSMWPAVLAACRKQGITDHVQFWVAAYPNKLPSVLEPPHGAVAWQFTDKSHGRSLDESVVLDYWPGVDPTPTPKPTPTPHPTPVPAPIPTPKGKTMFVVRIKNTLPQFITDGIQRRWIQDPNERQLLVDAGVITDVVHDWEAVDVNRIPLTGKAPAQVNQ